MLLSWVEVGVGKAAIPAGTVYFDQATGNYYFKQIFDPQNGVAFGTLQDQVDINGWHTLNIETSSKYADYAQM